MVLPGGFSYGDYLRCGAIAARAPIMRAVSDHAARGGLVLGICNGFQILCEAGLLPGVLMRNADRRFVCRLQHLRVENVGDDVHPGLRAGTGRHASPSPMARGISRPTTKPSRRSRARASAAFRYCDAEGRVDEASNPNGSQHNIAGVFNSRFNVLGLMPHPENLIDPLTGGVDGRPLFDALAA